MSQAYSQYIDFNWKEFKKGHKKRTEREFLLFWRSLQNIAFRRHQTGLLNLEHFTDFNIFIYSTYVSKYKTIDHYFLENGVADFCIKSVKEMNSDYMKMLPVCEPFEITTRGSEMPFFNSVGFDENMNMKPESAGAFFIHFPSCEKRNSILVFPNYKLQHMGKPVGQMIEFYFVALKDDCVYWSYQNPEHAPRNADEDFWETLKMIAGFSLYIDAFPDVVREADGVKHVGHYKGHRHSVRANDVVRTEATHSVSPHFRRGHFRLLSSERFKAKRGQAVFIKGCFVKGHAYDVLADDGKSAGGDA